jgi:hypothetical protein
MSRRKRLIAVPPFKANPELWKTTGALWKAAESARGTRKTQFADRAEGQ